MKEIDIKLSMKKTLTILLFCIITQSLSAQNHFKFKAYVIDSLDNSPLVRASILVDFNKTGTVTNDKGFFEITLPRGEHTIIIKHLAYRPFRQNIRFDQNLETTFKLNKLANELEEVIISAKGAESNVQRPVLGVNKLNIKTLQKLPTALGELDILRGLQLLPGVTSVGEAANGVNIRGGTTDQNLLLLDDMPIFNPTHMFGLFSAFPSDGVSGLELYKGNIPARFGGRTAAVLDVALANPSLDKFKMNGGISFVSNRIKIEAPIIKDKLGIMFTARGSYNDFLFPVISPKLKDVKARFADAALKVFYRINNKNTLTFSSYYSKDFFQTGLLGSISEVNATSTQYDYKSLNYALKWFSAITPKFNVQTSYINANYSPNTFLPELNSSNKVIIASSVRYKQLKSNFNYFSGKHKVEAGIGATLYDINPGELIPGTSKSVLAVKTPLEKSLESAIHIEDEITLSPKTTISLGLRYSMFNVFGPANVNQYLPDSPRDELSVIDTVFYKRGEIMKTYGGFEPRLGIKQSISKNTSLKFGYNLMRQYIQVVTNTTTPLPTSRWKTSDTYIRPQIGSLISGGLFHEFPDNIYELSIEGYWRQTNHIVDYKAGANFLLQSHLETQLLQGKNKSYGIELMISKKKGELTGWLNYTYSRSLNKVYEGNAVSQQVNFGNWYPTNYDRPHTVNAILVINQGKNHDFSFNFSYSTGRPFTSPQSFVQYEGQSYPFFDVRNNSRIPDYHRLDFAWNIYNPTMKDKRFKGNWTFTVYNLYGRKNAYSVFFRTQGNNVNPYKLTIFGSPILSLSYNFKFI